MTFIQSFSKTFFSRHTKNVPEERIIAGNFTTEENLILNFCSKSNKKCLSSIALTFCSSGLRNNFCRSLIGNLWNRNKIAQPVLQGSARGSQGSASLNQSIMKLQRNCRRNASSGSSMNVLRNNFEKIEWTSPSVPKISEEKTELEFSPNGKQLKMLTRFLLLCLSRETHSKITHQLFGTIGFPKINQSLNKL